MRNRRQLKVTKRDKLNFCSSRRPSLAFKSSIAGLAIVGLLQGASIASAPQRDSSDAELLLSGDNIFFSASKMEQKIQDVPAAVSVITAQQIKDSGAQDIITLLRSVPGVDVTEPNRTQANVSIRGFNVPLSNKVLVMIDGQSVYQDVYGGVFWDQIPVSLDRIARIEIVRGPGSALYGANALNGVINIITKTPSSIVEEQSKPRATVAAGSQGGFHAETYGGAAIDQHTDIVASGSYVHTDGLGLHAPGRVGDRYSFETGTIDVNQRTDNGNLRLTLNSLSGVADFATTYFVLTDNNVRQDDVTLNYSTDDREKPFTASVFAGTSQNSKFGVSFLDSKSVDAELQKQTNIDNNQTLVFGGSYREIDGQTFVIGTVHHRQTLWSVYGQDDVHLTKYSSLFLGIRHDHDSLYGGDTSPRVSWVNRLTDSVTTRLSYGTSFQAPSEVDSYLDLAIPVAPGVHIQVNGNPALHPTKLESLEVGVKETFGASSAGIDFFQNRVSGLMTYTALSFFPGTPVPSLLIRSNGPEAHADGVEIEYETSFGHSLSGFANYSYQNDYQDGYGPVDLSPHNKINIGVTLRQVGRVSASLIGHYVSSSIYHPDYSPVSVVVSPYGTADGQISYRLGQERHSVVVSLAATNLFDNHHSELPQTMGFGPFAQSAPELRTVWMSASGSY